MFKVIRATVAAVPPEAKVCSFSFLPMTDFDTHYAVSLDSPLPDNRLPNGGPVAGRPNSWGTANWPNGPSGGTIAGLGKPPPGRDPKSRARSRDYLKQCVARSHNLIPRFRCWYISYSSFYPPQMSAGNIIFDLPPSDEPSTQPALGQQHVYTTIFTQRPIVRPNCLSSTTKSVT